MFGSLHITWHSVLIMLLGKSITLINIKFEIIQLNFNNAKLTNKIEGGEGWVLFGSVRSSRNMSACACVIFYHSEPPKLASVSLQVCVK